MKFTEILRSRGIDFKRGGRPGEITLCCPFCIERNESEDTRNRLGVNVRNGKAQCFNCNWSSRQGTLDKILRQLSVTVEEKIEEDTEDVQPDKKPKKGKVRLPEDFERLWPAPRDKTLLRAYHYLRNRGLTDQQIKRHRVGISLSGRYGHRVIFPVKYGRKLKGFVARDYTGKQDVRYLNSDGTKALYNCPLKKRNKVAVLLEGILKALAIERVFTKKDAIGLLGRSLTPVQKKMLKGYKKLILWPDPGRPGVEGMLKIAEQLHKRFEIEMVQPVAQKKDPDEMAEQEIRMRYRTKVPWSQTLAQKMRARLAFGD